jgi:hypothetical protein
MLPPERYARGGVKSVALSQGLEPVTRTSFARLAIRTSKKMCSRHKQ